MRVLTRNSLHLKKPREVDCYYKAEHEEDEFIRVRLCFKSGKPIKVKKVESIGGIKKGEDNDVTSDPDILDRFCIPDVLLYNGELSAPLYNKHWKYEL